MLRNYKPSQRLTSQRSVDLSKFDCAAGAYSTFFTCQGPGSVLGPLMPPNFPPLQLGPSPLGVTLPSHII